MAIGSFQKASVNCRPPVATNRDVRSGSWLCENASRFYTARVKTRSGDQLADHQLISQKQTLTGAVRRSETGRTADAIELRPGDALANRRTNASSGSDMANS